MNSKKNSSIKNKMSQKNFSGSVSLFNNNAFSDNTSSFIIDMTIGDSHGNINGIRSNILNADDDIYIEFLFNDKKKISII